MGIWESFKTASKGSVAVIRERMKEAMASPFIMMKMDEIMSARRMKMAVRMRPEFPGLSAMTYPRMSLKHMPMHRLERGRHGAKGWNR